MSTDPLPAAWRGLVDDAAIFPPGDAALGDAAAAHVARRSQPYGDLVGTFVVRDTDLPALTSTPIALSVVLTGGAGQVAGPADLCRKLHIALEGLELALRDLDDLPGNARRVVAAVDAARADGVLDDHVPVYVELPRVGSPAGWLAAADVVAEHELRLKFRTGGLDAVAFPAASTLARWIDASLDRETPFKCTAGLHRAVRHTGAGGFEHHGFLNVLVATRLLFDGTPLADVVEVLELRDGTALADQARSLDLAGARRWFTSFGSCDVDEPRDDLLALGLLEDS
ncbi:MULTISPECIES: hypothetical protein [unclassified Nocardioides]|uniref:hypothetical protein n=1 Tax=unclassified Nocardioides TaxID=2615069 RepID=UPI0009EFCB13|nr:MULTISPECIES: hypothetical protein [unclassified Nocardioides]GAW48909.1 uncharacterized protein PD653B2_1225 [Nocardioides sp. PD653-B2]GAW54546.1 uncharacterized protein PD653_1955 [Nocardioides sp. PD653]